MKRLFCTLLASLLLLGALASCGTAANTADTTAGDTIASSEVDTRETLDVPDTRYDGQELCFLTRAGQDQFTWATIEIFAESQTSESDNISNAVFERNDRIFQNYGVTITEIRKDTSGEHHTAISNETSAPTGDFQAVVTNVSNAASFSTNGFLWDLNGMDVEYMDFSKPWWDTNMAEGMSIDGRLFFATGDIMTLDNDATFIIVFNKQMVVDCGIPDMYALVENGEWTLDKFYEFEQQAVQDKNGDGKLSYDTDVCGFAYTQDVPYSTLFGGGITLCQKDADDFPVYKLDVERAQNIAELGKLIFADSLAINMSAISISQGTSMVTLNQTAFGENHALFMSEVMQCVTRLRGFEADFGILPFPKYNAAQESYCSMMHGTASVVAIPRSVNADKLVMVNSMIEAMAYHSVDTLTEQYYEINLKTKGARDEQSGPMIDMILSGRVCDLSYYYGWGGNAFSQLANCLLPSGGKSVASTSKSFERAIGRNIEQLMKAMDKIGD